MMELADYLPDGEHVFTADHQGLIRLWNVHSGILEREFARIAYGIRSLSVRTPTHCGEAGFITASVVDPLGNMLGIMYNPHYLEILSTKQPTEEFDSRTG